LSGVLAMIGAAWLWRYAAGGYGANNSLMLDPLHDPWHYLWAMPPRALALLTTWVVPVNPFIFYVRPAGTAWLYGLTAVGAAALAALAVMFARHHRGGRGVATMALWSVVFLPLLACSMPDDRNMMLPGIGLSFLAAAWLTRGGPAARLRRLPLAVFVVVPLVAGQMATVVMRGMEVQTREALAGGLRVLGRPAGPEDCLFFVNLTQEWLALFTQYGMEHAAGAGGPRVAVLSDVADARVTRVGERALRIEGGEDGMLAGFLGRMGHSRQRPRREGEVYSAGEFEARLARVEGGVVRAVELRFRRPLDDERYRFLRCGPDGGVSLLGPPLEGRARVE
jgi:hypothetical protein